MFNQEWRQPRTRVEVAQFEIQIALDAILLAKINDGLQWNMKELIDQGLLMDAGLATVLVAVSSPSSQERKCLPIPNHRIPSKRPILLFLRIRRGFDESYGDSLPPYRHRSTLLLFPCWERRIPPYPDPFILLLGRMRRPSLGREDQVSGEVFMDIMSPFDTKALHHPLVSISKEAYAGNRMPLPEITEERKFRLLPVPARGIAR
ncbi:hypothetical protein Dimus_036488 [Dionaea muscipula]